MTGIDTPSVSLICVNAPSLKIYSFSTRMLFLSQGVDVGIIARPADSCS